MSIVDGCTARQNRQQEEERLSKSQRDKDNGATRETVTTTTNRERERERERPSNKLIEECRRKLPKAKSKERGKGRKREELTHSGNVDWQKWQERCWNMLCPILYSRVLKRTDYP